MCIQGTHLPSHSSSRQCLFSHVPFCYEHQHLPIHSSRLGPFNFTAIQPTNLFPPDLSISNLHFTLTPHFAHATPCYNTTSLTSLTHSATFTFLIKLHSPRDCEGINKTPTRHFDIRKTNKTSDCKELRGIRVSVLFLSNMSVMWKCCYDSYSWVSLATCLDWVRDYLPLEMNPSWVVIHPIPACVFIKLKNTAWFCIIPLPESITH